MYNLQVNIMSVSDLNIQHHSWPSDLMLYLFVRHSKLAVVKSHANWSEVLSIPNNINIIHSDC